MISTEAVEAIDEMLNNADMYSMYFNTQSIPDVVPELSFEERTWDTASCLVEQVVAEYLVSQHDR